MAQKKAPETAQNEYESEKVAEVLPQEEQEEEEEELRIATGIAGIASGAA